MDPRQERTRRSLKTAVYALASQKPIGEVTATEVARAAGISRDTFYRHAASPVALLTLFLGEELDEIARLHAELPQSSGTAMSVFDEPERRFLGHLAAHATIYRRALAERLHGAVRDMLVDHVERTLLVHLERHPGLAPEVDGAPAGEVQKRMFAAYAASGTIGAIEVWLRADDPAAPVTEADAAAAARTVLAASPEWWLGRA